MEFTSISSFLKYYERMRERTNKLIAVIPEEYVDWAYKDGKFSIADHIRHLAAIERYMYAETVQGKPCKYLGCGKELADGFDNVLSFFKESHFESMQIFNRLSDSDLQQQCQTPGNASITIWKWLRTLTEHEIHHRAQLYVYLNMLGVETPPMFGMSSEEIIISVEKNI
ncbi:DinB family protein [Roseivirga seohaensis]|uniref:DinB family protein n=1 Tax=Roseivirga seohaensis TaxID=1914963 RepID=UPI003BAACC79